MPLPLPQIPARPRTPARRRRWNRGDLLLLACGLVAFLVMAFLSGPVAPARSDLAGSPHTTAQAAPAPPAPSAAEGSAAEGSVSGTGPAGPAGGGSAGTADAPDAPDQAGQLPALPPAAAPLRVVYPAAGFDVVVHPLEPSPADIDSQTIVPPVSLDGFWLTTFGSPGAGSSNTTYIMGHSWDGRDAPFNRLSSGTAAGDLLDVTTATGTVSYRVDSITTEAKTSLKDHPIWQVVPNRLVLISCYTEDLFGKNVVLVASPAA